MVQTGAHLFSLKDLGVVPPASRKLRVEHNTFGLFEIHIDHLLAEELAVLTEQYIDNFAEWLKSDRALPIAVGPVDAITAINLTRLTNTTTILPLALMTRCPRNLVRKAQNLEAQLDMMYFSQTPYQWDEEFDDTDGDVRNKLCQHCRQFA
ncbi:hypothetical protein BC628DRAFT_1422823 [Trametes gibbosa]|nr:hypothetical protein BC628DRAFT_1422823 [Trametes gibbosa]